EVPVLGESFTEFSRQNVYVGLHWRRYLKFAHSEPENGCGPAPLDLLPEALVAAHELKYSDDHIRKQIIDHSHKIFWFMNFRSSHKRLDDGHSIPQGRGGHPYIDPKLAHRVIPGVLFCINA